MKTLLLGVAIAAILIMSVPALRNAGRPRASVASADAGSSSPSDSTASAISTPALRPPKAMPVATPLPDTSTPGANGAARKYRSPLGGNGGLGDASFSIGETGGRQVYTVTTLPDVQVGQTVRLRLSRPLYEATQLDETRYAVRFLDQDLRGTVNVIFPAEGAEALDLIRSRTQPGLTFYIIKEIAGYRAVGQNWRADTKQYSW